MRRGKWVTLSRRDRCADLENDCASLPADVRNLQDYGDDIETALDNLETKLAGKEIYWEPPGRPPWIGVGIAVKPAPDALR
jgi:hypothetical protein